MKPPVLLLSDLHLPSEPSPLRETFRSFLEGPARGAAAVYILGDLFEYWIGDDLGLADHAPEIAALRALTCRGVPVYVQRGNRDFLLGRRFAAATGAQLLADPVTVNLDGVTTLLSHGDVFCTDDVGYQRWRRFAHHPLAQALFLALPRRLRHRAAARLRARSSMDTARKPREIMDVNPAAVAAALAATQATRLIHGHTHRPDEHELTVAERHCQRIVLADWRPRRREYLVVEGASLHRVAL